MDKQDWLRSHQAKWNVPSALLSEAISVAGGSQIRFARRLYKGEANESYEVRDCSGLDFVVRIARRGGPWFEGEKWALEHCLNSQVNAPVLLALEHCEHEGEFLSIAVETKLDGMPLDEALRAGAVTDVDALILEAGQSLAQIHSIPVSGYGPFGASGIGSQDTAFRAMWHEANTLPRAKIERTCLDAGLSKRLVYDAFEGIRRSEPLFADTCSCLVHGDYGPKHLLTDGDSITGIVDFENCRGFDPSWDFAWWDFFYDFHPHPTSMIISGYISILNLPRNFKVLRKVVGLYLALYFIDYFETHSFDPGLELALKRLQSGCSALL